MESALQGSKKLRARALRVSVYLGLLAVVGLIAAPYASAGIVSLTAATPCMTPNGNGGDWCQSNGMPFNLSSFTTQNLTTTGSSGFFA
ncbi:MAG: hypothetical protein WBD26_15325, partial [Candidatus Acidiferrales bacterium]